MKTENLETAKNIVENEKSVITETFENIDKNFNNNILKEVRDFQDLDNKKLSQIEISVNLEDELINEINKELKIDEELNELNEEAEDLAEKTRDKINNLLNEEYNFEFDPLFKEQFEKESFFRLKTYDREYFNNNYSGLSEDGYLIDLNGKKTMSKPSMNIGGRTGDLKYSEFLEIEKQKFFHRNPEKLKLYQENQKFKNGSEKSKTIEDYENKEVVEGFEKIGLPLNFELKSMLEESKEHQGGRRGSGFTQASRFLAERVRSNRSSNDISIFDISVKNKIEDEQYINNNNQENAINDPRDYIEKEKLDFILKEAKGPGSKLIIQMIEDILEKSNKDKNLPELPALKLKEEMKIGTCTTAERYFLDYANNAEDYGENFKLERHTARMNVFVDESGEPIFIEKINLGQDHSAISLKPFYLNGVKIPIGSLIALQYDQLFDNIETVSGNGSILKISDIKGVEFLRFTTLVVDSKNREKTFGNHLKFQIEQGMKGAESLEVQDFIDICKKEIGK